MRKWQFEAGVLFVAVLLAAVVAALGGAGSATASAPTSAVIHELATVVAPHDPPSGTFTATGIPGCTSGTFGDQLVWFSPSGARLVIDRTYACAGGDSLTARVALHLGTIDAAGEQAGDGTWRIISGTGALDGLAGSGSTSGISSDCAPVGSIFGFCSTSIATTTTAIH